MRKEKNLIVTQKRIKKCSKMNKRNCRKFSNKEPHFIIIFCSSQGTIILKIYTHKNIGKLFKFLNMEMFKKNLNRNLNNFLNY